MTVSSKAIYSSKIIKAGALLANTKILLANWDVSKAVSTGIVERADPIFYGDLLTTVMGAIGVYVVTTRIIPNWLPLQLSELDGD